MRPEPAFEAPWHAHLFAVTVHLHDQGHFTWPDWAARFGAMLKSHGAKAELNGGDDYFAAWLDTLEEMLTSLGHADDAKLRDLTNAWRQAYLATPHGQPVSL